MTVDVETVFPHTHGSPSPKLLLTVVLACHSVQKHQLHEEPKSEISPVICVTLSQVVVPGSDSRPSDMKSMFKTVTTPSPGFPLPVIHPPALYLPVGICHRHVSSSA